MKESEQNQKGYDIMLISRRLRQCNNKGEQEKVNKWIDALTVVAGSLITDKDTIGRVLKSVQD